MKALSSEPPQRTKRASKPQKEKRRRERINQNLEALRLLMLQNTDDQNLKNPKVGKAEILESVVHFLKTGGPTMRQGPPELQAAPGAGQQAYQEGRRSCLRRISHFLSSRGLKDAGAASFALPHVHGGHVYAHAPACDSTQLWLQQQAAAHPHLTTTREVSPLRTPPDPVWRPWPQ